MVRLIESIIGALPYHCHGWSVRLDAAWPALERVFVRGRAVNSMSPRMCADVRGSTSLRLRPSPTGRCASKARWAAGKAKITGLPDLFIDGEADLA
jgi:hypothetical protein